MYKTKKKNHGPIRANEPMSRSGFAPLILILIIAIAAAAAGIYFVAKKSTRPQGAPVLSHSPVPVVSANSTSSIDISGWQTYRNEQYGFELKYPNAWFTSSSSDRLAARPEPFTLGDDTPTFLVQVFPVPSRWNIAQYLTLTLGTNTLDSKKFCADIVIDGQSAYDCLIPNEFYGDSMRNIVFVRGGNLFNISDIFKDATTTEIISSLRFVDTISTSISNWQTYRNEKYGFEVKYPKVWEVWHHVYGDKKRYPVNGQEEDVDIGPTQISETVLGLVTIGVLDKPITYGEDTTVLLTSEKVIAGEKATVREIHVRGGERGTEIEIPHGRYVYYIDAGHDDLNQPLRQLPQILSTFKFTR